MTLTPLEPWIAQKIGLDGRPLGLEALHTYQLAKLNETLTLCPDAQPVLRPPAGVE